MQFFALVIELNEEPLNKALSVWDLARKEFDSDFISSRSVKPHITILDSINLSKEEVVSTIQPLLEKATNFTLEGNGLGVLLKDDPLLYWRWKNNECLQALRDDLIKQLKGTFSENCCNDGLDWIAKTSFCYKDLALSDLNSFVKAIENHDFFDVLKVNGIALYEYSLKKGENKVEEFIFSNKS